jgi:pimeloyl-ACP methyl ester carboxylesterase
MMGRDIQNRNTDQSEKERFDRFLDTHKKFKANYKDVDIEYCFSGEGEKAILVLPHISSLFSQEMAFHLIMELENTNKVLAPELGTMNTLDEIADAINYVLEKENIAEVIIYGQSGSGITAQVFFNRYYHRVKGMILVNTVAPRNETKNPGGLLKVMKLFPGFLLKFLIKKKFSRYSKNINIPEESIARINFSKLLLQKCFHERFSKETFFKELKYIFEFNHEKILSHKDLPNWKGKVLIITSEDDPGYEDSKKLADLLPNADMFVFEPGYGHLAPAIKSEEFYSKIHGFLKAL